jgi:hypothetical protein
MSLGAFSPRSVTRMFRIVMHLLQFIMESVPSTASCNSK